MPPVTAATALIAAIVTPAGNDYNLLAMPRVREVLPALQQMLCGDRYGESEEEALVEIGDFALLTDELGMLGSLCEAFQVRRRHVQPVGIGAVAAAAVAVAVAAAVTIAAFLCACGGEAFHARLLRTVTLTVRLLLTVRLQPPVVNHTNASTPLCSQIGHEKV